MKDTRITTKALCLALSLGMAAGMMPISALAEATPETAAAYEISDETLEEAPPSQPASPETAQVPQLAKVAVMSLTDPAVGDEIVIDQVTYRITKLPTASSNGKLTLVDGKNVTGDLIVANGMEYAGGKYDVTELGNAAFMDNTALTSVDLSDTSVSAVGQNCFRDCTALNHVDFAENTITNLLKTGVFAGCTSLTSLEIAKANISGKSPFSGSSIRTMTIYAFSGSGDASEFSGLPEGFTLNCPGSLSTYQLDKNAFGTTKNVTLNVATEELQAAFAEKFAGKSVTVKLFGEAETVASVSDSTGTVTGYASLEDAIRAVNDSQDQGPFTITTRSSGELIEWNTDLAPAKETVIDFAGCSVDLPDTLTLQAPLTIRSVTNFDTEGGLCTVDAGEYAFVMIDGGSFGFAEIKGSDLRFEGTLPGGLPLGQQVRLTGEGEAATVEFSGIGSSEYYYDLPNMSGFTEVELQNSYLEADRSETFHGQLEDVDTVTMDDGGLKLNADASIGTLSGRGELRFAEGAALKVTGSADGSFTLPEFEGSDLTEVPLTLPEGSDVKLTNKDGTEIVAEAPVMSVQGGTLPDEVNFASWEEAAALLEKMSGSTDSYTLTLKDDLTLPEGAVLPDVVLTIDGKDGDASHTLSVAKGKALQVQNSLTLQNLVLDMDGANVEYVRASNGEKTLTIAATVTGNVGQIVDRSKSRWLDICLQSSSLAFDKIIGTTSTIDTQLTDLILTGLGSKENPLDLTRKVENLAAVEINNSWLTASGDASGLGTIRTDYTKQEKTARTGGLILTGDTILKALSITENDDFELWMPAGAVLTVNKKYTFSKRHVPVYVEGTLQDGWALIKAPDNGNKNAADYCLANAPAGVLLYWDEADPAYKVSYAPEVAMSADAASYKDYYTKVVLTLADGQGIDAVTVNGKADPSYTVGETQYLPDTDLLEVGENTVVVTDVTGNSATFNFRYDRPADYTVVEEALAGIPADLTGYTAGSVQAVRNAVNAVVYGAGQQDQADVDGMALAIRRAVEGLTRAMGTASSQNQDQHPEIAEAIKNGTWGKEDNTSKPAQQASGTQVAVPQTSDTENVTLWVALMAISLVGLAGLGIRTIKRRKETR
ncbi:MAG TPA: leucine-rich repeat domain-containing protein [Candidatus Gemmiger faecavium]|nr:leucine-rich repeat domain-containing protein [Candidatus Gemmiger faecavium]